jgi:Fe2+ transport system protein FeoA
MKEERHLSSLKPKSRAKIKKVSGEGNLKRKFLDMGIIPGVAIEVVKLAPLGDPIEIKIKGYNLSLRKDEARQISVEVEA